MKRIILTAFAGASLLGLAACNDADDAAEDGDTTIVEESAPPVTETTTVVTDAPGGGDSVTVDKKGVTANINDGDTSVTADVGKDPSVTVKTD
jgi:hypothetical protein